MNKLMPLQFRYLQPVIDKYSPGDSADDIEKLCVQLRSDEAAIEEINGYISEIVSRGDMHSISIYVNQATNDPVRRRVLNFLMILEKLHEKVVFSKWPSGHIYQHAVSQCRDWRILPLRYGFIIGPIELILGEWLHHRNPVSLSTEQCAVLIELRHKIYTSKLSRPISEWAECFSGRLEGALVMELIILLEYFDGVNDPAYYLEEESK